MQAATATFLSKCCTRSASSPARPLPILIDPRPPPHRYCDAFPDVKAGWIDALGSDHEKQGDFLPKFSVGATLVHTATRSEMDADGCATGSISRGRGGGFGAEGASVEALQKLNGKKNLPVFDGAVVHV